MAESWVIAVVSWVSGERAVRGDIRFGSELVRVVGLGSRSPGTAGVGSGRSAHPVVSAGVIPPLVDGAGPDEAGLVREHDRLGTVAQVELVEQVGDVGLDGRLGEEQRLGDLAVGETAADQL